MTRVTQDNTGAWIGFAYWTITNYGRTFQTVPLAIQAPRRAPTTPTARRHAAGLGSSPFARHYWGNH